jgi:hypothetical protein
LQLTVQSTFYVRREKFQPARRTFTLCGIRDGGINFSGPFATFLALDLICWFIDFRARSGLTIRPSLAPLWPPLKSSLPAYSAFGPRHSDTFLFRNEDLTHNQHNMPAVCGFACADAALLINLAATALMRTAEIGVKTIESRDPLAIFWGKCGSLGVTLSQWPN